MKEPNRREFLGYSGLTGIVASSLLAGCASQQTLNDPKGQIVLPIGHTGRVTSVDFSPDGRYALSSSKDKSVKLWEVETGREVNSLESLVEVTTGAFSPDSKYILYGGRDDTLGLWNILTNEVSTFKLPKAISSLAFSPDGQYALVGSYNRTISLQKLSGNRELRTFKVSGNVLAFSPDGRYAICVNGNKEMRMITRNIGCECYVKLKLWELSTEQDILNIEVPEGITSSVVFSQDGEYFLCGTGDNTLKLWETFTGKEIRSFKGHKYQVNSVAFSPDGKQILSGFFYSTFEYNKDNQMVLWDYGEMKLWEVLTGREINSFEVEGLAENALEFSSEGRYALAGLDDGSLRLLETSSGRKVSTLGGHTQAISSVAIARDTHFAVTGLNNGTQKLWDISTGRDVRSFKGHKNLISVVLSPDNNYILACFWDTAVSLWDTRTGKEICTFKGHKRPVFSADFSPDGQYVVSGGGDILARMMPNGGDEEYFGEIKLWETFTGKELRTFKVHNDRVTSVVFSPNGRYVLSGDELQFGSNAEDSQSSLKLWEVTTGNEIPSFYLPERVNAVTINPDGNYALAGSEDGLLKLFEVPEGKDVRTFIGHKDTITSVGFSPDGRYILSGSRDNIIKLWEVDSGQEIHSFSGHKGSIISVAFAYPDGRYIVSSSNDRTLKYWNTATGQLLLTRLHLDENDWVVVTPDGRFDGSPNGIQLLHYSKNNKFFPMDIKTDRFYTPNLVPKVLANLGVM